MTIRNLCIRRPGEGRGPVLSIRHVRANWIPACAGTTKTDGSIRSTATYFATLLLILVSCACNAKDASPESSDPALEARMVRITSELRCLVCQNQTIADSHADLAVDLRRQVREQLQAGRTDGQIVDYMTARYGDFVLYRPPFKGTTALLWLGPALMLVIGGIALIVILRRRHALPADAFDADEDDEPMPGDVGRA